MIGTGYQENIKPNFRKPLSLADFKSVKEKFVYYRLDQVKDDLLS